MKGFEKMHEDAIRRAIRQLAGCRESMITEGVVQAVDWPARTCSVLLPDGRLLPAVRLKAIADDEAAGLCLRPVEGSTVLVANVGSETEQCVLLCSAIDGLEITGQAGSLAADLTQGTFTFNGGNNKGLAMVDSIAERLNELEAALQEIKSVYANHTHQVTGIGSPTATPLPPLTYTVPNSTGADFENPKIKH